MSAGACLVCGGLAEDAFNATVLYKHEARYVHCPRCQYLRVDSPHWLQEAYGEAIARADTGLVARNLQISRRLACVLDAFFDPAAAYLDTAGGTGLLTRLMRDIGFDFWWEDPYCANVLAAGFEAAPDARFEAVTAFEAIEHMTDPMSFVRAAVDRSASGTFVFTTELYEGDAPPGKDWWYYSFPTGQHISFFTARTLESMAALLGVNFHSASGMHLFTREKFPAWRYRRAVRRGDKAGHRGVMKKMKSRTEADHRAMLARGRS